jgi:fermentation-respiration switch protein FrsA (DUF1100 family)
MPNWLVWVVGGAVVYGLLCLGASRMLYYPMRYPHGEWHLQRSHRAEDVWLRTSDGVGLHAWWLAKPGASLATLHLHGNGGNITHRSLSAKHILAAGSSLLLLDYRGYGKSDGTPTEQGLYRDADAGYEWLVEKGYAPAQIVLHGESLGTVVALEIAVRKPCAGVVLEAPLTSAKAVAGRVLPLLGPLLIWGYDSKSRIVRLKAPLFIIHGDADEVIAYEFGQELYQEAPGRKSFWTIRGGTHNDLHVLGGEEFPERLREFYGSLTK